MRKVFVLGQEVIITTKEFDLLMFFMEHPKHVIETIWGKILPMEGWFHIKYLIWIIATTLLFLVGCNDNESQIEQETGILIEAEEDNDVEKVQEIEGGNQVKQETGILIKAVENNDVEKVQEILQDTSYPINETNDKKETPLLIATHKNYIEVAKLLIEAGADINQQDRIQDSAYLYAGAQGKTEILKYMIEHAEPNQNIYNRFGGNALIPAAEKGHLNNVKLLLADGKVDIDHQNNFGYTALIEAVALRDGSEVYQQIVQELLAYNANKDLRDDSGKTALDYAKEKGYTNMIKMLEE